MDENRQHPSTPEPERRARSSSKQCVVELLRVTSRGVVFWSRHPLDIASELQLRMSGLGFSLCKNRQGKVRGYVIDCKPARRDGGTVGFEITVLFDDALARQHQRLTLPRYTSLPGMPFNPLGLN